MVSPVVTSRRGVDGLPSIFEASDTEISILDSDALDEWKGENIQLELDVPYLHTFASQEPYRFSFRKPQLP